MQCNCFSVKLAYLAATLLAPNASFAAFSLLQQGIKNSGMIYRMNSTVKLVLGWD